MTRLRLCARLVPLRAQHAPVVLHPHECDLDEGEAQARCAHLMRALRVPGFRTEAWFEAVAGPDEPPSSGDAPSSASPSGDEPPSGAP